MKEKLNGSLLLKVKKHILQHSESFDMGVWLANPEAFEHRHCGTVGCIAGWTCMLDRRIKEKPLVAGAVWWGAAAAIGVTPAEAKDLFYVGGWDNDLQLEWQQAKDDDVEKAKITAKAIDRFYEKHTGKKLERKPGKRAKVTNWNQADVLEETPQVEKQVR